MHNVFMYNLKTKSEFMKSAKQAKTNDGQHISPDCVAAFNELSHNFIESQPIRRIKLKSSIESVV